MPANKKMDKKTIESILTMHDNGLSGSAIAKLIGYPSSSVNNMLRLCECLTNNNLEGLDALWKASKRMVQLCAEVTNYPYEYIVDYFDRKNAPKEEPKVEPVQEAQPEPAADVKKEAPACSFDPLVMNLLLLEQRKTNELLIQFMDVVLPEVICKCINGNSDIIMEELKKQRLLLDSIRGNVKRIKP